MGWMAHIGTTLIFIVDLLRFLERGRERALNHLVKDIAKIVSIVKDKRRIFRLTIQS